MQKVKCKVSSVNVTYSMQSAKCKVESVEFKV